MWLVKETLYEPLWEGHKEGGGPARPPVDWDSSSDNQKISESMEFRTSPFLSHPVQHLWLPCGKRSPREVSTPGAQVTLGASSPTGSFSSEVTEAWQASKIDLQQLSSLGQRVTRSLSLRPFLLYIPPPQFPTFLYY